MASGTSVRSGSVAAHRNGWSSRLACSDRNIHLKLPERQRRILHFTDLGHGQKIAAVQTIASRPLRALSVIAAKQPIPPDVYVERNQLYFYMTRYLVERLSWLCRDYRPSVPEGDGRVAITFSRRGGMNYDDFRDYLQLLKADQENDVQIHWPVIDIEAVAAADHPKSASLQLADTIASAFAAGFEPDRYGNCELRYAETLKPVTYCRKNNFLSYGVKIVPKPDACGLNAQQIKMLEIWK